VRGASNSVIEGFNEFCGFYSIHRLIGDGDQCSHFLVDVCLGWSRCQDVMLGVLDWDPLSKRFLGDIEWEGVLQAVLFVVIGMAEVCEGLCQVDLLQAAHVKSFMNFYDSSIYLNTKLVR
jgi:hypothetical protein